MSARGAKFPFGTTRQTQGYALEITVHPGPQHFRVRPPAALGGGGSQGCWPTTAFQALLVASEYCAAVQELLVWAFPSPDWDDYKPMVAQYAAEFITSAAPVPVTAATPPAGAQLDPVLRQCSHSLWSNFTYLYFHGTRDLNLEGLGNETKQAAQWLKRLVGDRGWAPDGLVFSAARTWTDACKTRLAPLFPTVPGFTTPAPAPLSATGGTPAEVEALHRRTWAGCPERELVERVEKGGGDGPFYPVYPYRITSGYSANRIKFTMQRVSAPRSIKGSCGVPADYGQSHNCALGYLLLADVMQAFNQASKQSGNTDGADDVTTIDHFINNVLLNDSKPLLNLHGITRYGTFLAGCCLGWAPALEQVRGWVKAAADALPEVAAGNAPPQLVLPATLTPALIQAMAAVVQQVQAPPLPPPLPPPPQQQPQAPQPKRQQVLQPQDPPPAPAPQLQLQPPAVPPAPLQQPHLAHLVQLPNAASGGSIVSGPPTGSSGGSGTSRSPFAALQQAHQQMQPPGLAVPVGVPGTAGGAGGGPGPQLPQLPDLPQFPPAAGHPQSSPSAEDVAGGMSNMSLDGPTFGDETLAALAADMRSLKEVDIAAMGRQPSAALVAQAAQVGHGPGPSAASVNGSGPKAGEGMAAVAAAHGPFGALAAMNQLQGFGMPGPSGRTVTTSAPGPVQQPQHLPPTLGQMQTQQHQQQILQQQQQAQAARAAAATAVSKVVELLGSASHIMAQLAAAPAPILEPSVQARLGALVRGQEDALRAFRLEFNLPEAAGPVPSAASGGAVGWPPTGQTLSQPGPAAVAPVASGGAPLPPPGPHVPPAGSGAGAPARAGGSPFERLVRMPGTSGGAASSAPGQPQPALSAGGGSSGGGRNSLPGLIPGAFGAAVPAQATGAAAPGAIKLEPPKGAAGPGALHPENLVVGPAAGPAPGPAGTSPPSSGGVPASSGSAGNTSGSTLGLLAGLGDGTAGGENMSLMLQLMEGGGGAGGETLGGGNVSLMSLGNDSLLLGLDGNGTLGLGLGQAGVDPMGSEGVLVTTAGGAAAAGGSGMEGRDGDGGGEQGPAAGH
ncbi:hypothetical protein HYH02_006157 [Chlamydomonas schloesseri]|uniref:Uncharacterized protein n=1 Tax=Chlamydomonas schloesseri TaxID=2026947 RepID=A0A836B666_9CHLO|nr:hypothetical protein HYH02_006157 [Chlamydomonas schloesseri]|eukprot:KAG2448806.1 hypothetical protein HYH02_006157 [Chlamydomonas schloesseri]